MNKSTFDQLYDDWKKIDAAIDELAHRNQLLEKEVESLKRENTYLKQLIEILTKNVGTSIPPVPMMPAWNEIRNCSKCGLKLEGVMGYVCPHAECPTGLGGTRC